MVVLDFFLVGEKKDVFLFFFKGECVNIEEGNC